MRRKVVRAITVYAAAAFVILELVDIITEPFGLPDWTLKFVVVLLCIGLIISIILSWIYDIHPEGGIVKTEPAHKVKVEDKAASSQSWKFASYISFIVIIALVLIHILSANRGSKKYANLEKSIAVLPFENMSNDEEYSHIGSAFTDEIIMELQKIKGFDRVLSRTSTMQYDETRPTIPEIAEKLNVNYIIEGSIQRYEEDVRVRVQVIRALHEDHVWADEFDGKWKDIFSIQDGIALKVADELKAVLSVDEIEKINRIPTKNPEAYDYYLRGNDYYWRSLEEHNWNIAINMYRKAIELDSTFVLPYTRMALCYLHLYWFHYDRSEYPVMRSKEAIDKAFSLEPDLPEAYMAMGIYYYYGFMNYSQALKYLELALEERATDSELIYYIACVHRRLGNWERAEEGFREAMKYDPGSSRIANNAGDTYILLHNFPQALYCFDRAISLNPDFYLTYIQKVTVFLRGDGNTELARESLEEASLIINSTLDPFYIETRAQLYVYEGYYQQALDYLSTADYDIHQSHLSYIPKNLINAWIYGLMNDTEQAYAFYNSAQIELEASLLEFPGDSRIYSSLGIAYAGLGQKQKAIDAGAEAVALMPISRDAWRGVMRAEDLARIYVMVGEYDSAIKQLDLLLSIPSELTVEILKLDPTWRPLDHHPDFIRLLEE
jgi:TolB-like protein/Tfp pilus assembly protein PilF